MYAAYASDRAPVIAPAHTSAHASAATAILASMQADAMRADAAPDPIRIRHFPRDHSVFADGTYLIRGVAGAILWKLLREFAIRGRTEFNSRELRASGEELGLPDICDNLSTRLILLAERLDRVGMPIRLKRLGAGRMQLAVGCPVLLEAA